MEINGGNRNMVYVRVGNLPEVHGHAIWISKDFQLQEEEEEAEKRVYGIAYAKGKVNGRVQLTDLAIASSISFVSIGIPSIDTILNRGEENHGNLPGVVVPSQSLCDLLLADGVKFVGYGVSNLAKELKKFNMEPKKMIDLGNLTATKDIESAVKKFYTKDGGRFTTENQKARVAVDAVLSLKIHLEYLRRKESEN